MWKSSKIIWNSAYKPGQLSYLLEWHGRLYCVRETPTILRLMLQKKQCHRRDSDWGITDVTFQAIPYILILPKCQHHDANQRKCSPWLLGKRRPMLKLWHFQRNPFVQQCFGVDKLSKFNLLVQQREIWFGAAFDGSFGARLWLRMNPITALAATIPQLVNINYSASATNSDWIHFQFHWLWPRNTISNFSSNRNFDEIWIWS